MIARVQSALALFLLTLAASSSLSEARYMPPEFDLAAVPGYSSAYGPMANSSNSSGTPAFDGGNHTSTAAEPAPTDAAESAGLGKRDVWSPRIMQPQGSSVWKVGETVVVRWDASHPPKHVTNYEGKVVLGHFDDGDYSDEHLDFKHPLAEGFNLTKGSIEVVVPHVAPSNEYIIILFGDSGNSSPQFTISD